MHSGGVSLHLPHLLKALESGIEVALSDTESHRGENWRGNSGGTEIEQKVATFLDLYIHIDRANSTLYIYHSTLTGAVSHSRTSSLRP